MVLLDLLLAHKGPVMISGYDTDLYNTKLAGWTRMEFASRTQAGTAKTEIIWMNFDPGYQGQQMQLKDYMED